MSKIMETIYGKGAPGTGGQIVIRDVKSGDEILTVPFSAWTEAVRTGGFYGRKVKAAKMLTKAELFPLTLDETEKMEIHNALMRWTLEKSRPDEENVKALGALFKHDGPVEVAHRRPFFHNG